jgi:hypothetical protein
MGLIMKPVPFWSEPGIIKIWDHHADLHSGTVHQLILLNAH